MKNSSVYIAHKAAMMIGSFLLVICLNACSRKVAFTTSTVVPAAEGRVKVKKDNNGNNAIDIEVRNLAEPEKLPISQRTYVVWMESSNGIKNLGQLKTSSGLFSSTLKAGLETVSPFKPTRIFVTAENDASIQYPGNQVVLATPSF